MSTKTKSVGDFLRKQIASDPELSRKFEKRAFCADIGRKLYQERKKAGLSQKELANKVGTKQSVISRLESADYDGYSVETLHRVFYALGLKLRLEPYACAIKTKNQVSSEFSANWKPAPTEWKFSEVVTKYEAASRVSV